MVPDRETATTKGNGVPAGVGSDMRPYDTGAVERQPSPPADRPERVIAVTVTYRRPELLLPLIQAVRGQTRPPDGYLVVDNGGDAAVPDDARGLVEVLRPGENLGPAGGYALGFERALAAGASRVWVLDDDVVPDPSCLARLLGSDADVVLPGQRRTAGSQAWLPWVGGLYRSGTVASAGPPRADYFFGSEDYEFLRRLRGAGARIERVSEYLITHAHPMRRSRGQPRSWRLYYEIRNTLHYRLGGKPRPLRVRLRAYSMLAKTAGAIIAFEPSKRRSLALLARGVRDYRSGRMGRTVDPAAWEAAAGPVQVREPRGADG